MNRRNRIIIAVIIILLIILAVILFWYRFLRDPVVPGAVVVVDQPTTNEPTGLPEPDVGTPPVIPSRTKQEVSVETLAMTFTERYGSYSNEAEFQNLLDLEPIITERFQAELDLLIATTEVEDYYHAYTTRVISLTINDIDEETGTASISVTTQREEAIGSPLNTTVIYQTLVLDMVKQGGVWLVDDATWE